MRLITISVLSSILGIQVVSGSPDLPIVDLGYQLQQASFYNVSQDAHRSHSKVKRASDLEERRRPTANRRPLQLFKHPVRRTTGRQPPLPRAGITGHEPYRSRNQRIGTRVSPEFAGMVIGSHRLGDKRHPRIRVQLVCFSRAAVRERLDDAHPSTRPKNKRGLPSLRFRDPKFCL